MIENKVMSTKTKRVFTGSDSRAELFEALADWLEINYDEQIITNPHISSNGKKGLKLEITTARYGD